MSEAIAFWLTVVSAACWIVCFWWMHRISSRQDALLVELHEQTNRIEELSKKEHDLIREVHPQVNEIKASVAEIADRNPSERPA
jgi:cell division protein FtsB